MANLLRLVACLFVLLSFNAKALVINGCTIEAGTSCPFADLSRADLSGADLSGADLSGFGANLSYADLSYADLSGADLSYAYIGYANLRNADLRNADLFGAALQGANLTDADLTGADLTSANLNRADLTGISGQLSGALGITLPSGYIITNSYIVGPRVDLTDADLTGADLAGVDLSGATLINVSGQLSDASGITLPSGYTLEGLVIKADGDNDGYSDELEIAISGDTTSVDSTTFAAALSHLTADADNDGVPDDYETAAGGDTTSSTFESVLAMLTVNKNVPAMGGIGLLALGLSMLGLGAVRLRKK